MTFVAFFAPPLARRGHPPKRDGGQRTPEYGHARQPLPSLCNWPYHDTENPDQALVFIQEGMPSVRVFFDIMLDLV